MDKKVFYFEVSYWAGGEKHTKDEDDYGTLTLTLTLTVGWGRTVRRLQTKETTDGEQGMDGNVGRANRPRSWGQSKPLHRSLPLTK